MPALSTGTSIAPKAASARHRGPDRGLVRETGAVAAGRDRSVKRTRVTVARRGETNVNETFRSIVIVAAWVATGAAGRSPRVG
jgi:hypothetical protein